MKKLLFIFGFLIVANFGHAQKKDKNAAQSIIKDGARISKYHNKEELDNMSKGQLLDLYMERIETLVNLLPYIAFATKPGVTMSTLGIPNTKDNRKILEDQFDSTDEYVEKTKEFQGQILPYSDTNNLTSAILFYEEILKSLHQYSDLH